jgi:hypothetical protein
VVHLDPLGQTMQGADGTQPDRWVIWLATSHALIIYHDVSLD